MLSPSPTLLLFLKKFLCLFFIIFSFTVLPAKTIVIPIEGTIDPSILKYLKRAVKEATNELPDRIIFEINTFGGQVDTTYEIVELILSIEAETISVVKEKAISAGTLIALSSSSLYMKKNSTLGDVAPLIVGQEGPKMLGEKFQSPLRAKFRSLSQKNGYPIKLSEAFVSKQIGIIEVVWKDGRKEMLTDVEWNDLFEEEKKKIIKKKTIVAKGELLTLNDQEAFELGFSTRTITQLSEIVGEDEIIYLKVNPSEKLFSFLTRYAFLMILIGLGGIYLEIKNPGFGFYGIIALIAFSLFFLSHYVVELANYLELTLLVISLILIGLEIFVFPGIGILGIPGVLGLIISLVLMMQKFTFPVETYQWDLLKSNLYTVMLSFLGSTTLFLVSLIFFPKIFGKSALILKNQSEQSAAQLKHKAGDSTSFVDGRDLIGQTGIAYTDLKPSGQILVEGKIYDSSSQGEFINQKDRIMVIDYQIGTYYVVKKD